jgi:hypothetical protein
VRLLVWGGGVGLVVLAVMVVMLGWLVSGGAGGGVLEAGGLWWGVGAEVEEEV